MFTDIFFNFCFDLFCVKTFDICSTNGMYSNKLCIIWRCSILYSSLRQKDHSIYFGEGERARFTRVCNRICTLCVIMELLSKLVLVRSRLTQNV
ncbi:hypothetical protein XELAEV_18044863mg [Xenopus laevis]|uniref:Uncharacterized protein n=1 Tax=Xenopus laevis TaxID=8355 RepID=A0A974H3P1_XENLA|nr:hypothetical protein XELAEV_18044863mg [Xenopus laevis]